MNKKTLHKSYSSICLSILVVASIHAIALAIMSLIRLVFVMIDCPPETFQLNWLFQSLLLGLQFDNLVMCYISALPLVVLSICGFCNIHPQKLKLFLNIWYFVILIPCFILMIANIPYFSYFNDHFNIGIFEWFTFVKDTAGMIFQDWHNYIYLTLSLIFICGFIFIILKVEKKFFQYNISEISLKKRIPHIAWILVVWALCVIGTRGTFERYPLRIGIAYFCDNNFFNHVGINPIFNIIESAKYKGDTDPTALQKYTEKDALDFVQKILSISPISSDYNVHSPLSRNVTFPSESIRPYNVVIILLESLAADDLEKTYHGKPLMPYLSNLRTQCCYFPNFYSAGIHTNCGITATLYGYAPNFSKHTMTVPSHLYTGLPMFLKQYGYETHFFVTSNPQYDRMNSFLHDNFIQRIHSTYDYPSNQCVNNFGIPDKYLFEYGLEQIRVLHNKGIPFLSVFLTVSNHPPYIIPKQYENRGATDAEKMLAYMDDNIQMFIEEAKKEGWGSHTIFVLVGDHGHADEVARYDMPLQYNHIPCYLITPETYKSPIQITTPAMQIDLFATIMGCLQRNYRNNTLGIDLQHNTSRKFAFFTGDNHLGCADSTYFYCYNLKADKEFLYRIGDGTNITDQLPKQTKEMRNFSFQMMRINNMATREKWTQVDR